MCVAPSLCFFIHLVIPVGQGRPLQGSETILMFWRGSRTIVTTYWFYVFLFDAIFF